MKLEPGDIVCDQCKGTGYPNNNKIDYNSSYYFNSPHVCDKCNGTGKLDWIEAIVGKHKHPESIMMGQKFLNLSNKKFKKEHLQKIEEISELIKEEIDKDIIKSLIGEANGTRTWGSNM